MFAPTTAMLTKAVDQVGRSERANDVLSVLSCHIETVVLLTCINR